jgi:NAD(P)-dependent dehydrogenase (short-subunit alcohol dehydrogenase family)
MSSFRDKVAIITGGASGIGRSLCEELARRGAVAVVADIDLERAEQVASAIRAHGGRGEAVYLDVSSATAMDQIVRGVAARHERLDYMFNNAAIAVVGELRDTSSADWRRIIDVNLMGVIYGTMAAYNVMIPQQSGHIVNMSSVAGLIPSPVLSHYGTTKWGIIGFSTSVRPEAATLGINVSVACPSLVRTNIPDRTLYLKLDKEAYLARLPWRWMADPRDAANAILRGVARNKAMIVFPFHGRLLWWCYRCCPALLTPLSRWTIKQFRKLRRDE